VAKELIMEATGVVIYVYEFNGHGWDLGNHHSSESVGKGGVDIVEDEFYLFFSDFEDLDVDGAGREVHSAIY
jgi:hypothetical protein